MKCYYAHPLTIYNTQQEERDILTITKLGVEVVNPNEDKHQKGYELEGMDYFLKMTIRLLKPFIIFAL